MNYTKFVDIELSKKITYKTMAIYSITMNM